MLDKLYKRKLIEATLSDFVPDLLRTDAFKTFQQLSHRETMERIKGVVALSCFEEVAEIAEIEKLFGISDVLLEHLQSLQLENGLFSGGDNLESPPDSAFTINDLCSAIEMLSIQGSLSPWQQSTLDSLKRIARKAAPAMYGGGVHTPNHRWEISSALIGLGVFLEDSTLLDRAQLWLGEGIDIQSDGLYSERSPNYAAYVTNPCLISISRRLVKGDYMHIVNRNLRSEALLLRPDDRLETIESRRQDQFEPFDPRPFLSQARLLAQIEKNPLVVDFARELSSRKILDPARHLTELVLNPLIALCLPDHGNCSAQSKVESGKELSYTDFCESKLSRVVLRGSLIKPTETATVYAGSDFNRFFRVASGLSNNPTIFSYLTQGICLESLRISPNFFDLGPLRPDSLSRDRDLWILEDTISSGYYGPLVSSEQSASGEYELTDDGRFYAQMAFGKRHKSRMELSARISISVKTGAFSVRVHFAGPTTPFACALGLTGRHLKIIQGALKDGEAYYAVEGSPVVVSNGHQALDLVGHGASLPYHFPYKSGEAYEYINGDDVFPGLKLVFNGLTSDAFSIEGRLR
ncbi:hypothetical protein [Parascardovia denticolens]|uniref:hypothetical protein n=1 Tax=Parascardovia denticolens TaxID=78258 RepID=UPI00248F3E07|nr:hypothetical protein [Parascardovia denticolens]